jgi:hypothetical protein
VGHHRPRINQFTSPSKIVEEEKIDELLLQKGKQKTRPPRSPNRYVAQQGLSIRFQIKVVLVQSIVILMGLEYNHLDTA